MPNRDRRYSTEPWLSIRQAILARDNGICQIRGMGCKINADTVDHIISPRMGGAFYDHGNLRAACGRCNSSSGITMRNRQGWAINDDTTISITTNTNAAKRWLDSYPGGAVFNLIEIRESIGNWAASTKVIKYIINTVRANRMNTANILIVCEPHEIENMPYHHILDNV